MKNPVKHFIYTLLPVVCLSVNAQQVDQRLLHYAHAIIINANVVSMDDT
ncbi:MAG: hypothetical protein HKN08_06765, partial [Gammaproteobacteria bacterium]|nr:hypothetical protein [Gammaproteobacteria bacterium]